MPELGGEQAAEAAMPRDGQEADAGEGGGVVREVGGTEAGEEAEGEIEAADEAAGGQAQEARGDAEVGDKPEGFGGEAGGEAAGEGVELRVGEAIEEEVGDNEVVDGAGGEGEGVGVVGGEALGGVAARYEEGEHGGAEVDGVGVERWVAGEEAGEEAAVAVAEYEGLASVEEMGEEVLAAVLEGTAEGEVLEPAIGAGDAVEIGWGKAAGWWGGVIHAWRKGRKRIGVRRARSAQARRCRGERRERVRSSRRRTVVERVMASGRELWMTRVRIRLSRVRVTATGRR